MLLNTRETYGLVAQVLHWVTAGLILALLPLGLYMSGLPQDSADEVLQKSWLYSLHKTLGVSVFLIAVVRVIWAVFQPQPRSLNADRKLENLMAQSIHWILYGAIICMPLTGWLHHSASEGFAPIWWPLFQDLPLVPKNPQLANFFGKAHFFTGILLGFALALHVVGGLKHAVIDRDLTLRRMIPGQYRAGAADLSDSHFKRLPAFLAVLSYFILGAVAVTDYTINKPDTRQDPTIVDRVENSAAGWLINKEKSRLDIQIIQMGNSVSGGFNNWNAVINFDPNDLATASVEVEVDAASISLGGVSEQAKGASFLNTAAHPIARFVSESFGRTGDKTYKADGHLTLAGRRQPLTIPFSLRIEDERAFVEAELTIERLAFGIGEKGFSGEDQLGFGVLVKVILEAEKAPSPKAS